MIRYLSLLAIASLILSAQSKKVITIGISPEDTRELSAAAGNRARVVAVAADKVLTEIADADAVVSFRLTREQVQAAKKLQWIQNPFAGVEQLVAIPEIRDSAITLTNAKIIAGPNIADHAFAMLLALTRQLVRTIPLQGRQDWNGARAMPRIELNGRTAVVIGVGGIGMQIAQRAHAFGMRVIGVDPKDIPMILFLDRVVKPDRIEDVLPLADVVFMAAPHTPQTGNLLDSRRFRLMKQGSYFIAVSRGRTYSAEALVEALDSKRLAGAGIDVVDPEPLPADSPLWRFENVVITPHIATQSDKLAARTLDLMKDNLRRFLNGEPLVNVVDKQRGY
ncbi:MAG: D-2-hydroxyacid dehydrogenase [Bryobacteraceae bacterium]|nr:D-2-hydroxyacid dehydrogenase [Bryobacteraceae bacterium]